MAGVQGRLLRAELLRRLPQSPDIYAQRLDLENARLLLIEMQPAAYRAASFLDDRILSASTRGAWVSLADAMGAASGIPHRPPPHFIWHAGHVGSTLVSRLLDASGGVLPVREPLPLRALAQVFDDPSAAAARLDRRTLNALLPFALQLWSRTYTEGEIVVVKATSTAARLAPRICETNSSIRSLCLNLRAEPYLATLLAGENSPIDLRGHAPERAKRLVAAFGASPVVWESLGLGELAALSWLTETLTQQQLREAYPERVIAVDFDAFLADVSAQLTAIATHFGLSPDAARRGISQAGTVLGRYSKAPQLAFTPADRTELLAQSRAMNRAEIARGMAWLDAQARENEACARALA